MNFFSRAAFAALAIALPLSTAQAHATLETTQALPGKPYKGVVRIGHGCEGTPTISLKIIIPEGMLAVKPMPKAGWKLETTTGDYGASYVLYGKPVVQGVKSITWSGGNLPDAFYDEFVFNSSLAAGLDVSQPLYVRIIQQCENGANNWVEIPGKGGDAQALKQPAPFIRLAAAQSAALEKKVGDLVITQPWSRATPGAAPVAGGYIKISNTGKLSDRLISGTSDISKSVNVHEMSMDNGVMKMRELEQGLEIAAGKSVELKPGGLHLMFSDLKRPLKQGESFTATLVFEKAGPVTLEFSVEALGAQAPPGGHDHIH